MKKNLLRSLIYNGVSEKSDLKERSRAAVLNSISIIGVLLLIFFTIVDIIKDEKIVAIFAGFTGFVILSAIILVGITKKLVIGTTIVTYIGMILFAALLYTAGEDRAGYFWISLIPLLAIFFLGLRHGAIIIVLYGIMSYLIIFKYNVSTYETFNSAMATRALGVYIGVTAFTIAFELVRIKAFDQLEKTSADLVEKRRQTTMILQNVKQGIFLLDENLNLADERSTFFNQLFGVRENKKSFVDLIQDKLPQRDFVATKDYLELFFNKTVNPTLLSSINPIDKVLMNFDVTDTDSSQVWLEFDFERILLKNGDVQILGLFKDVTEHVLLEEQLIKEENEGLKNMENFIS